MDKYQCSVKASSRPNSRVIYRSCWMDFEDGKQASAHFDEFFKSQPNLCPPGSIIEYRSKPFPKPRGGARPGAGTKSPHKGGRKSKFGEPTKVVRIPASMDAEDLVNLLTQVEGIIQVWEPRTYDKARRLLQELREELINE